MTYTYDENLFSDFYKDVYGFRPRNHLFYDAHPADKQTMWNHLMIESARMIQREMEREEEAIKEFETQIKNIIEWGAGTRENALRWIVDSYSDHCYDPDYILYDLNLPFSYKEEIENAFQPGIDFINIILKRRLKK